MNGWINIYKPYGISSGKTVSMVKHLLNNELKGELNGKLEGKVDNKARKLKIGHAGTLDVEAQGVLPIAIGQATKLVSVLVNAKKQYIFTIKFGIQTDSADKTGTVINTTSHIPTEKQCYEVCTKFIGAISQVPPAYSALKINGIRAYKLARSNQQVTLPHRIITIYNIECIAYKSGNNSATYIVDCSKGTYIRTLAEDIAFCLQSLGFVIELKRTKVGIFTEANSVSISAYEQEKLAVASKMLVSKCLGMEDVLDDIPVLEADEEAAWKISHGQKYRFYSDKDYDLVWVRYDGKIIAIGNLQNNIFNSSRVFNH